MKVFVTGGSGFVGTAIVQELLTAGHQVLGLARSDSAAAALAAAGAEVHRGDLQDHDSLRSGVAHADAVIHAGFIHDFSRFQEVCEIDRTTVQVLGAALAGTDRPLVVTSGIAVIRLDRDITEADPAVPGFNPRVATEEACMALAAQGVRVSIVRLPPSVHGEGDHGFVPMLIDLARQKGSAAYIADGSNRWPAVHRTDAARLYRAAIEQPLAPGTRLHAVAEQGVPFRDIASVIGRRLQLPVVSVAPEQAAAHFGWFAHFAAADVPAMAAQTRSLLGWVPTATGLLEDIDHDYYFRSATGS